MSTDFADKVFQIAIEQAKAERDRIVSGSGDQIRQIDTPIVRDMRSVARQLGVVELLLEHQRLVYTRPARAYDLVEDALIRLGASNAELLENLKAVERPA